MEIQEFLDIAIAQSNIHSKIIDLSGSKQDILIKILCGLQTTKYGIIAGIEKLKSGGVRPGLVKRESIQSLRSNIVKSVEHFMKTKDLIKDEINIIEVHKELIEVHKEFIELIRLFVLNKEVLE